MTRWLIVFDDQEVYEADTALQALEAAMLDNPDAFPQGGTFVAIDLTPMTDLPVYTIGARKLNGKKPRTIPPAGRLRIRTRLRPSRQRRPQTTPTPMNSTHVPPTAPNPPAPALVWMRGPRRGCRLPGWELGLATGRKLER